MRRRWFAYSGILQRTLSQTSEVVGLEWQVWRDHGTFFGFVAGTFSTLEEAEAFKAAQPVPDQFTIVQVNSTKTVPALSKGVAVIPLQPLPVFASPGKVLTTRGFWDVTSITKPSGIVSNFAFGMLFLPVSTLYQVTEGVEGDVYRLREDGNHPDPLIDDPGFFAYDSFVRVTTDVNQDPPFHSKTEKRFPANSALAVVAAVEVAVNNLQSLQLNFGIRFRILVES